MSKMCEHRNRQAIASPSHWGKQIASVICLDCGKVLSSQIIDANGLEYNKVNIFNEQDDEE